MLKFVRKFFVKNPHVEASLNGVDPGQLPLPLASHLWWGIIQQMRGFLSTSMGLTEVLYDSELTEEQQSTVQSIQQSHNSLLSIITDMSLYGDLLHKDFEVKSERVYLQDFLARIVDLSAPELDHRGISLITRFEASLPNSVLIESKFVSRILHHLFNQAIKSTESGDKVLFSAKPVGPVADRIQFTIKHSGARQAGTLVASPGRNQIYPFDLELEVAKLMAKKMGGELHTEIDWGYGASFIFTLPVVIGQEQVAEKKSEVLEVRPRTADKLRILVADDNQVERSVLEHFLTCPEVDLGFAETGRKAVEAFRTREFDLVLMDLQMPEMTGLEATKVIRSSLPSERQPIVIAVTSHAGQHYRDVCLEVGMQGYLTKPVRLENLEEILWRYFPDFYQKMIKDRGHVPFLKRDSIGEESPAETAPVSLTHDMPLDFVALVDKLSGNEKVAKELVATATQEIREMLPALDSASRTNDKQEFLDLVHKAKGILAAVEAHSALETLAELREVAIQGVQFETRLTAMALERELDRIDHYVGQQIVTTAS